MRFAQLTFLCLFALFAAITLLLQFRYGRIVGSSPSEDKQTDPKAIACQKQGLYSAVISALCILMAMAIGILVN